MKFYYFLPKSTYFFRIINFVSKYLKPSLPHKNDTYFPAAGTTRYPHTKQTKTYQQAKNNPNVYDNELVKYCIMIRLNMCIY